MKHKKAPPSQPARPNTAVSNPGYPPQRIAITPSMLYAYAAMRGNLDKDAILHETDPLHTSLYYNAISCLNPQFELPANLPEWQRQHDPGKAQDCPRGSFFFQDISGPIYPGPPSRIPERNEDTETKNLTYEETKLLKFPEYLPNHFTGKEGYGNYGYVSANGCWVDPDGRIGVLKALHGMLGTSHVPDLPIGTTPVSPGPEDEMYAAFMDEVNNRLDGDGENDPRATYIAPATFARWAAGASQGDKYVLAKLDPQMPLAHSSGLRRCKRIPKPQVKVQAQYDAEDGSAFTGEYSVDSDPSLAMSSRGVDMNLMPTNFSYMDPLLAMELERLAYGEPTLKQRVTSWLTSSSGYSNPIVCLNEADACDDLASPEDKDTGVERWKEYTGAIACLEEEHMNILLQTANHQQQHFNLAVEHGQLYKEAYFMQERIRKRDVEMGSVPPTTGHSLQRVTMRPSPVKEQFQPKPRENTFQTPTKPSTQPKNTRESSQSSHLRASLQSNHNRARSQLPLREQFSQPHPATNSSELPLGRSSPDIIPHSTSQPLPKASTSADIPNSSSQSLPSGHAHRLAGQGRSHPKAGINSKFNVSSSPTRRRRYLERYFMEQQERHIININKTQAMNENHKVELKDVMEAVDNLKVVHQQYRTALGIEHVSEIPDLIPVRKKNPRPFEPDSGDEQKKDGENEEAGGEEDAAAS